MNPVKLAEGVYWVGAVDWDTRFFHGHTFSTHHGTTYNAYLIIDEKIALVDTVFPPFAEEMIERIKQIVPTSRQHVNSLPVMTPPPD